MKNYLKKSIILLIIFTLSFAIFSGASLASGGKLKVTIKKPPGVLEEVEELDAIEEILESINLDGYKKVGFPSGEVAIKEAIYEDSQYKVELISVNYKEEVVEIIFDVTNLSDEIFYIEKNSLKINGIESICELYGPYIISPGNKGRMLYNVAYYTLDMMEIKHINGVACDFIISDGIDYYTSPLATGYTNIVEKNKRDINKLGRLLYKNEELELFYLEPIENNQMRIYAKNSADYRKIISIKFMTIDGYVPQNYFYMYISPGSNYVSTINIVEEELNLIGLKDINKAKSIDIAFDIVSDADYLSSFTEVIKIK